MQRAMDFPSVRSFVRVSSIIQRSAPSAASRHSPKSISHRDSVVFRVLVHKALQTVCHLRRSRCWARESIFELIVELVHRPILFIALPYQCSKLWKHGRSRGTPRFGGIRLRSRSVPLMAGEAFRCVSRTSWDGSVRSEGHSALGSWARCS